MYNEIYTYLPDMHRWHLVAFVSFGYFCYYIREVAKVQFSHDHMQLASPHSDSPFFWTIIHTATNSGLFKWTVQAVYRPACAHAGDEILADLLVRREPCTDGVREHRALADSATHRVQTVRMVYGRLQKLGIWFVCANLIVGRFLH